MIYRCVEAPSATDEMLIEFVELLKLMKFQLLK